MKLLIFNLRRVLSAWFCCVALAITASAQEAASSWVRVAPPDEAFTVSMPRLPFPVAARGKSGDLNVAGQRYSLRQDNAEYTVWSFKDEKLPAALDDTETYLDRSAEIAWNLMIEPYWEKLKHNSPEELMKYNLTYDKSLSSFSGHPGRSYHLNLKEQRGTTHIYAIGSQIYIVAAAGAAGESANVAEFIKSFTLSLPATMGVGPQTGGRSVEAAGDGSSGGAAKETDYNRTFTSREVTEKARILAKPEPPYTEWARKFSVTGTVRLRFILRPSGEVGNITPVTRLPHGLTQKAIEAARRVKFTPAMKDGRAVAQYVTFEYNFNIY